MWKLKNKNTGETVIVKRRKKVVPNKKKPGNQYV